MLQVRQFAPEDTHGVASVIVPIQQVEFGIAVTLEDQPDLGNISAFYQHGTGNFWVAEASLSGRERGVVSRERRSDRDSRAEVSCATSTGEYHLRS